MRVVIINKSDSTGGAAIVSRRLMEALRAEGTDARMLVCEKITESPYIKLAASKFIIKWKFIIERLSVFFNNGFNRTTLFKIDTGKTGLPLWKHKWVKEADAILINWVNQGMLSLNGLRKIASLKKPLIITMHDMWWLTGVCHHAGNCRHFMKECGNCPLLGSKSSSSDISYVTWQKKEKTYKDISEWGSLTFVSVSNWLKEKANASSLLKDQKIFIIHNPFDLPVKEERDSGHGKYRLLFGAARLDDPIKGLDNLMEAIKIIKEKYPSFAAKTELTLFGNIKNPELLEGFAIPPRHLGLISSDKLHDTYRNADIVISASSYETLPGTLVEAQAYGCIPVSYNQGGQSDIIQDGTTGFLVDYSDNPEVRAKNLAEGIVRAISVLDEPRKLKEMQETMRKNVENKFSYSQIAGQYITLIQQLIHGS